MVKLMEVHSHNSLISSLSRDSVSDADFGLSEDKLKNLDEIHSAQLNDAEEKLIAAGIAPDGLRTDGL